MIRKKADKNILRIRSRFDGIEDSAQAMIEITDLAVVACLHDSRQRRVDCLCPNGISHERNFFVQMISLDVAENEVRHSIWIVHPIERNWRSQRRMRTDK